VVLTGGPGAGKTAVLELVRQRFCEHVAVLPESASILFGGGFPRRDGFEERRAAQRAIFHVQREVETVLGSDPGVAVMLCDRGTVDGVAYWPGPPDDLWATVGGSLDDELRRYAAVIHLRTPPADAYPGRNGVRVESAQEAAEIDARIVRAWAGHPRRFFVDSAGDFLEKAARALAILRDEVPECCRDEPARFSHAPA
jgi:predicted ATPase